ncbi:dTMP kinase [Antrihabitans sp. YC3-6]|uniref:Thymidylate kinase n=1 Tax=Antrihabitans stalagmiti TaxID=2799499 RepID=A0A934U2T5_9NOCA|nr:dTMP kinase [Antrihabitans stalagmiti]MBJ8338403.1 dTMP kinase [Antrihabitans stalagmiti]
MLITIEGVDGAGKHTLARGLCDAWTDSGLEVLSMGFPRYGESMHADLAAEALQGEHGDLASSVYGMAAMFALDRHDAARDLRRLINRTDIVLLDRYAASNAAYSAARLHESAQGKVVEWVKALEFERFAIPVPDVQLLLNIPVAVAAARAKSREQLDATRRRDSYELDGDLQQRTADVYSALAAANWVSPWRVVDGDVDTTQLAAQLVNKPSDQVEVTP